MACLWPVGRLARDHDRTRGERVDVVRSRVQGHSHDGIRAPSAGDRRPRPDLVGGRLIRNHPLPDGNKRVGFLCTVEFAERNGYVWEPPAGDEPGGEETVKVIERVAAGEMPVRDLADSIGQRLKEVENDQ